MTAQRDLFRRATENSRTKPLHMMVQIDRRRRIWGTGMVVRAESGGEIVAGEEDKRGSSAAAAP